MAHGAQGAGGARRRDRALRGVGLGLLGLAWLGVAGVGGPATGQLSSVQTNDQSTFLPADAESTRAAEVQERLADDSALPAFVVLERAGGLAPEDLAAAGELAEQLPALEVAGLDEGATAGDFLLPGAPVPVQPSQDGEAALLVVLLDPDAVNATTADGERPLGPVVEAVRDAVGEATADGGALAGATAVVTGPAGLTADLSSAFGAIDGVLLLVALGAVLVILVLVYRSPVLPLAVLLTSVLALALAGLVVYELADAGRLTLNGQSQGILSILVVGAATDYGLLLVSRYREELARTTSAATALARAWKAALEPVLASAGTVALGLLCLLFSDLNSNRSLGPVAAIGIAAAVLAALTFLPVLLALGRWVFWPRVPHPVPVGAAGSPVAGGRRGVWDRVAGLVQRAPRRTWVVTAAGLLLCAAFFPTFRAEGVSQSETFLTPVESVEGQDVLAAHFDAGAGQPAAVVVPADRAQDALAVARGAEGVTSAEPGASDAGSAEVLAQLSGGSDSEEALDAVRGLRADLAGAGVDALVGGPTATTLDTLESAERDRAVIIPIVLVVVLVILVLLLRSLLAGLLLVAANVLSYAATVGVGAVVFDHVLGFPGADPVVPLFAFVFLVALGIDYSIFLMTRVREESVEHGTRAGVLTGLRTTGGVITSAGVVLAATFAALAVVPLLFLAQLAFLVTLGVLLDTLLVRSLLVPGLVHDLGDRFWWPSRLSRRAPVDR